MVARVGDRIRAEIPPFQRLPGRPLEQAVRGNAARALAALREVREPTAAELELAADVGRERAEQGVPVESVLHAYRITIGAVWSRFGEVAREQHADVRSVIAFSETLWRWADAVMDVVAAAHREVELEQAREEQQRRDGFVLALVTGGADAARAGAPRRSTYGLDPEREYVCFPRAGDRRRRRALPRRRRWRSPARAASSPRWTATPSASRPRRAEPGRRASRSASARPRGRPRVAAAYRRRHAARCRPRSPSASRACSRSATSPCGRRSSPTTRSGTRSSPAT